MKRLERMYSLIHTKKISETKRPKNGSQYKYKSVLLWKCWWSSEAFGVSLLPKFSPLGRLNTCGLFTVTCVSPALFASACLVLTSHSSPLCVAVSVSPSPSAPVRVCPPLVSPEDWPSVGTVGGVLSYIQLTTRRAYEHVLAMVDDSHRRWALARVNGVTVYPDADPTPRV